MPSPIDDKTESIARYVKKAPFLSPCVVKFDIQVPTRDRRMGRGLVLQGLGRTRGVP